MPSVITTESTTRVLRINGNFILTCTIHHGTAMRSNLCRVSFGGGGGGGTGEAPPPKI